MTVRRVFLALGSNQGDRRAHIDRAVAAMPDVVAVSSILETDPVGGPPDQEPYLNCVVELTTDLTPRGLLDLVRRLEAAAGRDRSPAAVRWGPRPLDVDIIWIDGETVDEVDLVVPHPRAGERDFVLHPLAELAPEVAERLRR